MLLTSSRVSVTQSLRLGSLAQSQKSLRRGRPPRRRGTASQATDSATTTADSRNAVVEDKPDRPSVCQRPTSPIDTLPIIQSPAANIARTCSSLVGPRAKPRRFSRPLNRN